MKKRNIAVLSALAGALTGIGFTIRRSVSVQNKLRKMSDKHFSLFLMMNQWVKINQEKKSLITYFKQNNYKKIAIYGMSYVGQTLFNELKESEIEVVYGIDQNIDICYADIRIVCPEDKLDNVDAIVVTPIFFMDEIKKMLSQKVNCPIISLEDILYEI